jgi:hypothetical protein
MRRPLDFSIRSLQHPLDQLLDLGAGQDEVGELVPTVSGDEHPARIVDQQRSLREMAVAEERRRML